MSHMKNKAYKDMCRAAQVVLKEEDRVDKIDGLLKMTGMKNKEFMDKYFQFLDCTYDEQFYLKSDIPLSIFGGVMESLLAFAMLYTYKFIWTPQRTWVKKNKRAGSTQIKEASEVRDGKLPRKSSRTGTTDTAKVKYHMQRVPLK